MGPWSQRWRKGTRFHSDSYVGGFRVSLSALKLRGASKGVTTHQRAWDSFLMWSQIMRCIQHTTKLTKESGTDHSGWVRVAHRKLLCQEMDSSLSLLSLQPVGFQSAGVVTCMMGHLITSPNPAAQTRETTQPTFGPWSDQLEGDLQEGLSNLHLHQLFVSHSPPLSLTFAKIPSGCPTSQPYATFIKSF